LTKMTNITSLSVPFMIKFVRRTLKDFFKGENPIEANLRESSLIPGCSEFQRM